MKLTKHFKMFWSTKLPWAKLVAKSDGIVDQVWCKVCTTIESRERLLNAKLNSLYKHVGLKKAKIDTPRMVEGNICYYFKYVH